MTKSFADREWFDMVGRSALSTRDTLHNSYDIARLAMQRQIPGDFVECGVFAGSQAAAMAAAIMDPRHYWEEAKRTAKLFHDPDWPPRRVHLFDSFTGIPLAGPEDVEFIEAKHPAGLSACSLEQVKANMAKWDIDPELLVYHPGLFHDTMFRASAHSAMKRPDHVCKIAVLRLDGDLYESTRVILENLMPLVSPGGWIICDDWDLSGSRKAVLEYMGMGFGPIQWRKLR
jgi:hypothetical protein